MFRARRAMENRAVIDDERIELLEEHLKTARNVAEEREMMYEEVGAEHVKGELPPEICDPTKS